MESILIKDTTREQRKQIVGISYDRKSDRVVQKA